MEETRKIRMFKEWWEAYRWGVKINPKRYANMVICTLFGTSSSFFAAAVFAEIMQFIVEYYATGITEFARLHKIVWFISGFIIARVLTIYANMSVQRNLQVDVRRAANERILKAVSRLSVPVLEKGTTKDLIDKANNRAVLGLVEIVVSSRFIIDEFGRMVISAVILFYYAPLIFAILSLSGCINIIFNVRLNKAYEEMEQEIISPSWREARAYTESVLDSDKTKEVKLFGLHAYLSNSFLSHFKLVESENQKFIKRFLNPFFAIEGVNTLLLYVGALGTLAFKAFEKSINIGQMSLGFSQAMTFDSSLDSISYRLSEQSASAYKAANLSQLEGLGENGEDTGALPEKKTHEVRFENVGFYYGVEIDDAGSSGVSQYAEGDDVHNGEVSDGKRWIFRHLNLTFEAGKHYALVGQNGAGKTTLIKLLVGFYKPQEGRILVDGIDLRELNQAAWHRELGVLFQDFNNYQISARENIGFGNLEEHADDAKVRAAAKRSGADVVIEALPGGYDQKLGKWQKGGMNLSGGQWQKVALARAFMRDARFIVLDEPTAAIDAIAEEEIFNEIYREGSDKTIVLISHRFSTVRRADEIIVLEHGKLEEQGTHDELIAKRGRYHEMFTLQAKAYQA